MKTQILARVLKTIVSKLSNKAGRTHSGKQAKSGQPNPIRKFLDQNRLEKGRDKRARFEHPSISDY